MSEKKCMNYSDWYSAINEHLEKYKVEVLGIPGNGIYGDSEYGHILPCGMHRSNCMCESALNHGASIKMHSGWHHLNSSQTMCINFFAPLVDSKDHKMLNEFLSLLGIDAEVKHAEFEYTPAEKETNFDFFCVDKNDQEYFFEIKYTEDGISKTTRTKHSEETFEKSYRPKIENKPLFRNCTMDLFMHHHYQAYRNMAMASERAFCIFITMEGNERTEKELQQSIEDLKVGKQEFKNILFLHWEDLVQQMINLLSEKDKRGIFKRPEELGYYLEFKRKYLLD